MTFAMQVKEEIASSNDYMTILAELSAFVKYGSKFNKESITMVMENRLVAEYIYYIFKRIFNINLKLNIRIQNRFKI